ncbi:MAG: histidine phosphatase family protein [Alphaproteobacteria bacterium]
MLFNSFVEKIFLLRHDQVVFPPDHHLAEQKINGIILGQMNYPIINSKNQFNAQRYDFLAQSITAKTDSLDNIFFIGSDLLRVKQTFSHLTAKLMQYKPSGTPPPCLILDKNFREQHFGNWQGLTYNQIEKNNKSAYDQFWQDCINHAPPPDKHHLSESFFNLYQRSTKSLIKLLKTRHEKTLTLIAHDGVLRAILAFFYHLNDNHLSIKDSLNKSLTHQLPYLSFITIDLPPNYHIAISKKIDYKNQAKPVIKII